jgi:hypothetical protein
MDILDALDEIKSQNARHASVDKMGLLETLSKVRVAVGARCRFLPKALALVALLIRCAVPAARHAGERSHS